MANDSISTEVKAPLLPEAARREPEKMKQAKTNLKFEDIGVWTVMREVKLTSSWAIPVQSLVEYVNEVKAMAPIVSQFLRECISVSPWMMGIYLFASLWASTQAAIDLYFSSRLLTIIQDSITKRQLDGRVLAMTVLSRIAFTIVTAIVTSAKRRAESILSIRIRYLFEERLIQAHLRLDLPTFEAPETAAKINRFLGRSADGGGWDIFEDLVSKIKNFANVFSQIGFLFGALKSQPGGFWFATVCLGKSIVDSTSYHSLHGETAYIWDSNPHYRRMRSMINMATNASHRIEIISDVLVNYIQKEWKKARNFLGDTSDDHPETIRYTQRSPFLTFTDSFSEDFPLIFYAFQVYLSPRSFSLTSVALMQQASTTLTWTFYGIFNDRKSFRQRLEELKTLYEVGKIPTKLIDGDLRYPEDSLKPSLGMEVKFENVSFAYPNAQNVIKNVSFTIERGQTVVIVGINGSGKSTLLKLFNRLYDPSSGTVSIDGTPLCSFVASDVRRSMAMLFQSYTHFPISVRENISLGVCENDDMAGEEKSKLKHEERVKEAVRLGGSTEVIEKQSEGLGSVLRPYSYSWSTSSNEGSQAFQDKMKEVSKSADVSSGQWQRLALSRLFFRAMNKDVKFVAVDEPSASLDPKMEYELFESLRSLSTSQGKTMVFVTHRFGYLTRRADLILVMQNGCLIEQGKHNELVQLDGEYAKLYNLQAEAFLPDDVKN